MPISDIQFNKALRDASIVVLKSGKIPSLLRLTEEIEKRLPKEHAIPTFKTRHQDFRAQWNLDGMNKSLYELQFDLEVLYDSYLELGDRILRRLNLVSSSSSAQHAQMDRIESVARNLLFLLQNGDGYSRGFFDDFHDLSKVDLSKSTKDTIDLQAGTVELPQNAYSTKKLVMSHLMDMTLWPVKVQADGNVIYSQTPGDAPFKNLFVDTTNMWRHDVLADAPGPVSISFEFPISSIKDSELSISRIQIGGVSAYPQSIEAQYSVDGHNWLNFPGSSNIIELTKSSKYVNLDFPLTTVEFLRFTIYREGYDKITEDGYLTSFGIKNISVYTIGRGFNTELISKPFYLENSDLTTINKLSVSVSEEIPAGTDINYYVGLIDKKSDLAIDSVQKATWTPITPIGRKFRQDEPTRTLTLSSLSKNSVSLKPLSPLDALETYKGIAYYSLGEASNTYSTRTVADHVFGSAILKRGKNSWKRSKSNEQSLLSISNAYIPFSSGAKQKLYAVATEYVTPDSVVEYNDVGRTTIVLSRSADYRPQDGMSLIAPEGADPFSVPDPLHTIYEVSLQAPSSEEYETLTVPGTGKVAITKGPIEVEQGSDTVEYLSAYKVLENGADEDLITELESRATLANYSSKTIKRINSITTQEEIQAGKPNLVEITIGNDTGNVAPYETTFVGEIIDSTPVTSHYGKPLPNLTDKQLLGIFGRVKIKTYLVAGIIGEDPTGNSTLKYLPGVDFNVELIPSPATGIYKVFISRISSGRITAGQSVLFRFKYKKDLTRNVHAITSNRIFFDSEFTLSSGVRFKVSYRFVPTGTNMVLQESLVLRDSPGGIVFTPGEDYVFDANTGSITAVAGGRILANTTKQVGYATFSHKSSTNKLHTFSTWVFVSEKNPVKIKFSSTLSINTEAGERVSVSNNGIYIDISKSAETPELSYGWHQFIVTSLDPDIETNPAIRKVVSLLDLDSEPIFLAGGLYFSNIEGSRTPLTEVTIDYLRTNVLPVDHSKFAIDEYGRIVVNFQPNNQQEFYTYGYSQTTGASSPVFGARSEEFLFEYAYHRDEARTTNGVVFRAVLSRSPESDGYVTPKLHGYTIRIG